MTAPLVGGTKAFAIKKSSSRRQKKSKTIGRSWRGGDLRPGEKAALQATKNHEAGKRSSSAAKEASRRIAALIEQKGDRTQIELLTNVRRSLVLESRFLKLKAQRTRLILSAPRRRRGETQANFAKRFDKYNREAKRLSTLISDIQGLRYRHSEVLQNYEGLTVDNLRSELIKTATARPDF
jgi:hypothetical protein